MQPLLFPILLLALVSLGACEPEGPARQVRLLCEKQAKVEPLTRISQVRQLAEASKQVAGCEQLAPAFQLLDEILAQVQTGRSCQLGLVDLIRRFQVAHLAEVPAALRQFFQALAFQLSAECKMNLINNLERDAAERIQPADYQQFEVLEEHGVALFDGQTKLEDFDDVILLDDVMSSAEAKATQGKLEPAAHRPLQAEPAKLLLKVRTGGAIKGLLSACLLKFRPMYEKLILPLIKLSNLGYNYQGELLARELQELKRNQLVKRWYNIVQTCESYRRIELFEEPEEEAADDQLGGRRLFTLIERPEAAELKAAGRDLSAALEQPEEYEPEAAPPPDQLWILEQRELNKLVAKHKQKATEADRVRSRIVGKMLRNALAFLRSGQAFSVMREALTSKDTGGDLMGELVDVMEEIADEEEAAAGGQQLDSAVAGPRGSAGRARPSTGRRSAGRSTPARVSLGKKRIDGTAWATKLWSATVGRLQPDKSTLICIILAIAALIILFCSIIHAG